MLKTWWTEGGSEEIRTKKGTSTEATQSKCQRHLGQPFRGVEDSVDEGRVCRGLVDGWDVCGGSPVEVSTSSRPEVVFGGGGGGSRQRESLRRLGS
jgi:hypothetical protein